MTDEEGVYNPAQNPDYDYLSVGTEVISGKPVSPRPKREWPEPGGNKLKADKRVGGLYAKEKNGKAYLLGKLWYGQTELRIVVLPNRDKRNETHPDYIVVLNEVIKHQFRTRKRPIWARVHAEKHSG